MQNLVVLYPSVANFILEAEVWYQKFEICRINLIQDVGGRKAKRLPLPVFPLELLER